MFLPSTVVLSLTFLCIARAKDEADENSPTVNTEEPELDTNWCMKEDSKNFRYCPDAAASNEGLAGAFAKEFSEKKRSLLVVDYLRSVFGIQIEISHSKAIEGEIDTNAEKFPCTTTLESKWPLAMYTDCPEFDKIIFPVIIALLHLTPEPLLAEAAIYHNVKLSQKNLTDFPSDSLEISYKSLVEDQIEPWMIADAANTSLVQTFVSNMQKTLRKAAECVKPEGTEFSEYLVMAFKAKESESCSWAIETTTTTTTETPITTTTTTTNAPSTTTTTTTQTPATTSHCGLQAWSLAALITVITALASISN